MGGAGAAQGQRLVRRWHRRRYDARDLNVSLSFMGAGTFDASIITDGDDDASFAEAQALVAATDTCRSRFEVAAASSPP